MFRKLPGDIVPARISCKHTVRSDTELFSLIQLKFVSPVVIKATVSISVGRLSRPNELRRFSVNKAPRRMTAVS